MTFRFEGFQVAFRQFSQEQFAVLGTSAYSQVDRAAVEERYPQL